MLFFSSVLLFLTPDVRDDVLWYDSSLLVIGGLVVSALDQRPRGRGFESAGCRLSRSNRGPVAFCSLGLGLLNPPSSRGR